MKYAPRLNRYERRQVHEEKLKHDMGGTGVYVYENNTDGDLKLPKPTDSGIRMVGPRKRFQGDSYYMKWVGSPMNLLRFVEEISPKITNQNLQPQTMEENVSQEKKLLLDQPDTITHNGKVETIIVNQESRPLNDNTYPTKKRSEVLLTEDPLDGVEIILHD
jgi:hypothetical protein